MLTTTIIATMSLSLGIILGFALGVWLHAPLRAAQAIQEDLRSPF